MATYENYAELEPLVIEDLRLLKPGDKLVRIARPIAFPKINLGDIMIIHSMMNYDFLNYPSFVCENSSGKQTTIHANFYMRYAWLPAVATEDDKFLSNLF